MTTDKINVERHLQTIIVVIIVGLLGWVGSTVQETQVQLAGVQVELQNIKENLLVDRSKFNSIEKRLDDLERKLYEQ